MLSGILSELVPPRLRYGPVVDHSTLDGKSEHYRSLVEQMQKAEVTVFSHRYSMEHLHDSTAETKDDLSGKAAWELATKTVERMSRRPFHQLPFYVIHRKKNDLSYLNFHMSVKGPVPHHDYEAVPVYQILVRQVA